MARDLKGPEMTEFHSLDPCSDMVSLKVDGDRGPACGWTMIIVFAWSMLPQVMHAHEGYRRAMDRIASELRGHLEDHDIANLLVDRWERVDGIACELGNSLSLDLEAALAQGHRSFRLLDRHNLDALKSEHKLEMAGLIDEEQRIREAGRLLKADAIIFGYYTYTGDLLVLRAKAVDIQTSEQLVVLSATCVPDALINSLCGIADPTLAIRGPDAVAWDGGQAAIHPASTADLSEEADCMTRRSGSYCFRNNSIRDIDVHSHFPTITGRSRQASLLVRSGHTECFFERPAGAYEYLIYEVIDGTHPAEGMNFRPAGHGTLAIGPCEVGQSVHP